MRITLKRIITQTGVFKALDRPARGNARIDQIPTFMDAKNLQPYVSQELKDVIKKEYPSRLKFAIFCLFLEMVLFQKPYNLCTTLPSLPLDVLKILLF